MAAYFCNAHENEADGSLTSSPEYVGNFCVNCFFTLAFRKLC